MNAQQEMIAYRARIAREESFLPEEKPGADRMMLPKIGGTRSQEEQQLEGIYHYYGRRKRYFYTNEPAGALIVGKPTSRANMPGAPGIVVPQAGATGTDARSAGRMRMTEKQAPPESVASLLQDAGHEARERMRKLKRELKRQRAQRRALEAAVSLKELEQRRAREALLPGRPPRQQPSPLHEHQRTQSDPQNMLTELQKQVHHLSVARGVGGRRFVR